MKEYKKTNSINLKIIELYLDLKMTELKKKQNAYCNGKSRVADKREFSSTLYVNKVT